MRSALLILIEQMCTYLRWHSDILDGIASDVGLSHAPEAIAFLKQRNNRWHIDLPDTSAADQLDTYLAA